MIGNQRPRTLVVEWPHNGGGMEVRLMSFGETENVFMANEINCKKIFTRSVFILRLTEKQYKVDQQLLVSKI